MDLTAPVGTNGPEPIKSVPFGVDTLFRQNWLRRFQQTTGPVFQRSGLLRLKIQHKALARPV
jgi:hypothetical protein